MATAVAPSGPAQANLKKMLAEPSATGAPVAFYNTHGKEVRRDDDTSGESGREYKDADAMGCRGARDSDLHSFFSQEVFDRFGAPTTVGRLLEDVVAASGPSGLSSTGRRGWPVARQDDDAVYLKVSMPGLGKEHVKVWVEQNNLMIKGEGEKDPWDAEVPKYSGRIEMVDALKMDKIKVELKNGVLSITVPKVKKGEPKHPQFLLDKNCSIGHYHNATSATFVDHQGLVVDVSLKILEPPAMSQCFVRANDLSGRCCLAREPDILGTGEGLALLNIHLRGNDTGLRYTELYVYRAGPGLPSIHHVPKAPRGNYGPYPSDFKMNMASILPLGDDKKHFAVVFPTVEYFLLETRNHYTLHIYQSDSKVWSKKVALISDDKDTQDAKLKLLYFNTTNVVYAGVGLIGWVDLWWGILLCNVLDQSPIIRFVPLPVPERWKTHSQFRSEFEDINPRPERHMVVNNGVMKFIELKFHTDEGWMATKWSRAIASDVWHKDIRVCTSNLSATESSLLSVLPEMLDGKKLAWQKIISGGPTLSLVDDDVFYIMAKVDVCHPSAFVFAVDTRKLTLESCVECCAERMFGFEPTYVPSLLSSYFSTTAEMIEELKSKAIARNTQVHVQTQA